MTEHDTLYGFALDYARDDVDDAKRARIDHALARDPKLAAHYARIDEAMTLATQQPPEWDEQAASSVWDTISEDIGSTTQEEEEAQGDVAAFKRKRAAAAAALLCAAAALMIMWFIDWSPTRPIEEDMRAATKQAPAPARLALRAQRVGALARPLFASEDAIYTMTPTPHVKQGRVLFEVMREDRHHDTFVIGLPDGTVRVTGTVMLVEVLDHKSRVAIFEGSALVQRGLITIPLEKNEQLLAGASVPRLVTQQERDDVATYVDLDAHRRALDDALTRSTLERRPAPRDLDEGASPEEALPLKKAPQLDASALATKAEGLMRKKDHRRAYDLLKQASKGVSPYSARARAMELDMARIALQHMRDVDRARDHFNVLHARWPDHPATHAMRQQLCAVDACP